MKKYARILLCCLVLSCSGEAVFAQTAAPNVTLILADDLGSGYSAGRVLGG